MLGYSLSYVPGFLQLWKVAILVALQSMWTLYLESQHRPFRLHFQPDIKQDIFWSLEKLTATTLFMLLAAMWEKCIFCAKSPQFPCVASKASGKPHNPRLTNSQKDRHVGVHYTLYTALLTVNSSHCTLNTAQYTQNNAHWTLHAAYCTAHFSAHCTIAVQFRLHICRRTAHGDGT